MASTKIYSLVAFLAVMANAERALQQSPRPSPPPPRRVTSPSPSPPPPVVEVPVPVPVPVMPETPTVPELRTPTSECTVDTECTPTDACKVASCVAGVCVETDFVCSTTDLCLPQVCVAGACVTDTANQLTCNVSNPCMPEACETVDGAAKCVMKEVDCDDGNACTKDACTVVNGAAVCQNQADMDICKSSSKKYSDKCKPKVCVPGTTPTTFNCEQKETVCDDGDKCTMDMCNPDDGQCVFKNVCEEKKDDKGKKNKKMVMAPSPVTPSPATPQKLTNFFDYINGGNLFGATPATPAATPAPTKQDKKSKAPKGGSPAVPSPPTGKLAPGQF